MSQAGREPQLWERRPDESPEAYAAFSAFRDLGPGRSVVAAYRQSTGRDGVSQAAGRWNGWSAKHGWASRALAFDDHMDRRRRKAAERVAGPDRERWERRRDLVHRHGFRFGMKLLREAGRIADRAAAAADQDGASRELRRASLVGQQGLAIAAAAASQALAQRQETVVPGLSVLEMSETPEVRERARKRIAEWRDEQMPAVMAALSAPNPMGPDSAPDDRPTFPKRPA